MSTSNKTDKKKTVSHEVVLKKKAVGPWRIAWDRFRKNRVAIVGAGLFIIIIVAVLLVPILSPYNISEFDLADKELAPSTKHWLGTDEQGRDVMLRLFVGGRISILVGLMAAGVSVVLGSTICSCVLLRSSTQFHLHQLLSRSLQPLCGA